MRPLDMDGTKQACPKVDRSLVSRFMTTSGNVFFRVRNALFPLIFVVLFLLTKPGLFFGNPILNRIVMGIGIATAIAGQCFRLAVIGFAYIQRGGKDGRIYADNLVVRGFYAHCRNPMYVGNFLITVGMSLIYGSLWVFVLVVPFFSFVYLSIVTAEEEYLFKKFGRQYEEYTMRVNRFVPNFHGMRESLADFRFDWKKALRSEYGTIFGLLSGMIFLNLWRTYHFHGLEARREEIFLILLFLPLVLFYAVVRYLKKSRRLGS
jgi:protein-S-isoprenylcysteine O-methyltransferase Ste14